jgi:hypothetical protein
MRKFWEDMKNDPDPIWLQVIGYACMVVLFLGMVML